MSWFGGSKDHPPTKEQCNMYREKMDFIISNLKFSLIHHNARTDGTMAKAWSQEEKMLAEQISILNE